MHARVEGKDRVTHRPALLDTASLAVAAIALIAFLIKAALTNGIGDERRAVADAQQKIAQAQLLSQVNNRLIQLMATASAQTGDADLRQLLAANGVNFTVQPPAAQPSSPATPPASGAQP